MAIVVAQKQLELPRRGGRGTVPSYGRAARASGPSHFLRRLVQLKPDESCLRLPLRPAQQSLWFLDRLGAGKAYNVSIAVGLIGRLDVAALRNSLNEVIDRHESLRAYFPLVDGNPIQAIRPSLTLPLPIRSLEDVPAQDREAAALDLLSAQAHQPFNLAEDELVRPLLLRLVEDQHILLAVMPEIVCDPWSLRIFQQELAGLYNGFCSSSARPPSQPSAKYSELVMNESKRLEDQALSRQLSFWTDNLKNCTPLEMPVDRPRANIQAFNGATEALALSPVLTARLRELSRREEVTLFVTVLAAFQSLLHRYTGQPDILVGSPVDTRRESADVGLIGCFVNTLVMRGDLSGDPSFLELLARTGCTVSAAHQHQDIPFAMLVQSLGLERSPGNNPLFQVMFVLYQALEPIQATPHLRMVPVNLTGQTAEFDLTLYAKETEIELELICEYDTDLFNQDTICRMLGHLTALLEGIAADPGQKLSGLPVLTAAERVQILDRWNDNEISYPEIACFNEGFELQAEQRPEAIAVIFEDHQITYRCVNERANQLAHHLIRLGCGPETPVGVLVEPSVEALLAVLAILKAGGVYLPLDPGNPPSQLQLLIEDARPIVLLTQDFLQGLLPDNGPHIVSLDQGGSDLAQESTGNPPSRTTAENLCGIFFTSGSTGRPKGVMTPHRSSVSRLYWVRDIWEMNEDDRFLLHDGVIYASSITQLFLSSAEGGQLVIGRPGALDIDYLGRTIVENRISIVGFTPSMLRIILIERGRIAGCLRHVFCSAEALPNEVQRLFFDNMN